MRVAHGGARIGMAQHLLDLIEGMTGVDEKTCEAVPQIVNAHILKPDFPPHFVPEKVDVGKRPVCGLAGKKPGRAGSPGDSPYDGNGRIGQDNVARLAGLGQGHCEQTLFKMHVFPAGVEYFALARAGKQQQAQDKGLNAPALLKMAHKASCLAP